MASAFSIPADASALSVEEYLRSSYQPDCDYVDGHIEGRNVGYRYATGTLQPVLEPAITVAGTEIGITVAAVFAPDSRV